MPFAQNSCGSIRESELGRPARTGSVPCWPRRLLRGEGVRSWTYANKTRVRTKLFDLRAYPGIDCRPRRLATG